MVHTKIFQLYSSNSGYHHDLYISVFSYSLKQQLFMVDLFLAFLYVRALLFPNIWKLDCLSHMSECHKAYICIAGVIAFVVLFLLQNNWKFDHNFECVIQCFHNWPRENLQGHNQMFAMQFKEVYHALNEYSWLFLNQEIWMCV